MPKWEMRTRDSEKELGWEPVSYTDRMGKVDEFGTLEVGKLADVLVVDGPDDCLVPAREALAELGHSLGCLCFAVLRWHCPFGVLAHLPQGNEPANNDRNRQARENPSRLYLDPTFNPESIARMNPSTMKNSVQVKTSP